MKNEYIIDNGKQCFKVAKDLKDYVDSLQQENKQLKEIIDKAIKYIEHHYATTARTGMMFHECENVIEILTGETNE